MFLVVLDVAQQKCRQTLDCTVLYGVARSEPLVHHLPVFVSPSHGLLLIVDPPGTPSNQKQMEPNMAPA